MITGLMVWAGTVSDLIQILGHFDLLFLGALATDHDFSQYFYNYFAVDG